jgi:peptide/nickel transport system permease protein
MTKQKLKILIAILILFILPHLLIKIGNALDPFSIDINAQYQPPSIKYPFGTDYLGRNLLSRVIYATGLSMKISTLALSISISISLILGSLAGFFPNKLPDKIISWLSSILITTPLILLISATLSIFEPNIEITYITVGLFTWAVPARLVKAEVLQVKNSTFILAEKALGFKNHQILLKMIPLTIFPALASSLFTLPELISLEVGLSFLGFGSQPPTPSLGKLILTGIMEANIAWWEALFPISALALLIILIYILARKLTFKPG